MSNVDADWKTMLAAYTAEERERLEAAAKMQAARIESAAIDPTRSLVQDGVHIGELWFAVVRRREELSARAAERKLEEAKRLAAPRSTAPPEPQEAVLPPSEASADPEPPASPAPAPAPAKKAPAKVAAKPVKRSPARPSKT